MRYNDEGISQLVDKIKNNWNYLFIGDENTTDDGNEVSNAIGTLSLESMSTTSTQAILVFRIRATQFNDHNINSSYLSKDGTGTTIDSSEKFNSFLKDDLTEWRLTYTINLQR